MTARPSEFTLTKPGRLRIFSTEELLSLPAPQWLVEGTIPHNGLIGIYGQPGAGKSFVAIDLAMCVATGAPWLGHPTEKGNVLYISAEGGAGIGKRVFAWLVHHSLAPKDADIAWLTEPVTVFGDSNDLDTVFERIHNEVERYPTLVLIDTLARCFDGNENEQEDMGRFVKGVDRFRMELGSTVAVIHHTRLDGERERGNTAFRGAADTMISLEKDETGLMLLACNKQKDDEAFESVSMRLKQVLEAGSCVTMPVKSKGGPSLKEGDLLKLLAEAGGVLSFSDWLALTKGMSPATFKRKIVSLRETGEISKENGLWYVAEAHEGSSEGS